MKFRIKETKNFYGNGFFIEAFTTYDSYEGFWKGTVKKEDWCQVFEYSGDKYAWGDKTRKLRWKALFFPTLEEAEGFVRNYKEEEVNKKT